MDRVRIWASKVSQEQFESKLQSELAHFEEEPFSKDNFVLVDGLNKWYTLSHLQANFNKTFFVLEVREDIGSGVGINYFDEEGVGLDAVVEAVQVDEMNGFSLVILQLCHPKGP